MLYAVLACIAGAMHVKWERMIRAVLRFSLNSRDDASLGPGSAGGGKGKKRGEIGKILASETSQEVVCARQFFSPFSPNAELGPRLRWRLSERHSKIIMSAWPGKRTGVIAGAPPVLFSGSRFFIFADPTISETGIGYYSLGRPNLQWNSVSFQLNCLFIASGLRVQGCNPAP